MDLDQIMDEFSPEVQSRGGEYHRRRAVQILVHSADVVRARVKGTQRYDVHLQYSNKGVLLLSCTCPYFLGRGPCKHLWATALTAAEQGILAKIPSPTRIADAYAEAEIVNDNEASDIDLPGLRGISKPRDPHLVRNRPSIDQEPPASWEWLLDQSRGQLGYEAVATGPVTRELLYIADAQATKANGQLTLKVVERPRRKDGTLGKEKPARVPVAELPRLSDEHDRAILPLLQVARCTSGPSARRNLHP